MPHPPSTQRLAKTTEIISVLKAVFPNLLAIYAFGSRIQGTAQAGSDLDLAVLMPGYAPPLLLWDVSSQLANILACPVDLLDFRAASTVMQHQILSHGQRLWAVALEADLFECFVMSEKLALDTARAGLLADISERGSIYGR